MTVRGRILWSLVALIGIPLIALALFLWWMLLTEAGLRQGLALVAKLPMVQIEATGVHGTLSGPLAIDRLTITQERIRIEATGLRTEVSLRWLPLGLIQLNHLDVATLQVELRPRLHPPEPGPPVFLPRFLRIVAPRVSVPKFQLLAGDAVVDFHDIRADATITRKRVRLDRFNVDGGTWAANGSLRLRSADPLALRGRVNWLVRASDRPDLTGLARIRGDLDKLLISGNLLQPSQATFAGALLDLTDAWHFAAQLAMTGTDFAPWGAAALGPLTGKLDVAGRPDDLTVKGPLQAASLPLGQLTLAIRGGYRDHAIVVDSGEFHTATGGVLLAAGRVALAEETLVDFKGSWTQLRWPVVAGTPVLVTSPSGSFTIAGIANEPLAYSLAAQVMSPQVPKAKLALAGTIGAEEVTAGELRAEVLDGLITGSGRLGFDAEQHWQATLVGKRLNPGVIRKDLPGRVDVNLKAEGRGFDPLNNWDVTLQKLGGQFRGRPVSGKGRVRTLARQIEIDALAIELGGATLTADGKLSAPRDLRVHFLAQDLSKLLPELAGRIALDGSITGVGADPEVKFTTSAQGVAYGDWRLDSLEGSADLDLGDQRASILRIKATHAGLGEWRVAALDLRLDGGASAHQIQLRATSPKSSFALLGYGRYANREWRLDLQQLVADGSPLLTYQLAEPSTLKLRPDGGEITKTCFINAEQRLCAVGDFSTLKPWSLQVDLDGLQLRTLAGAKPNAELEYLGTFALTGTARGAPGLPWTADATVTLDDAGLRHQLASGRKETLSFGDGAIVLAAHPEQYVVSGSVEVGKESGFAGGFVVERRTDTEFSKLPITGRVAGHVTELGWVPLLAPDLDRASGVLDIEFGVQGSVGMPELSGRLELADGEIDVYQSNLLLRDMGFIATLAGTDLKFDGNARAGKGKVAVNGALAWHDGQPSGEISLVGNDLLVADVPEARVIATPDLKFTIDRQKIEVTGSVKIPTARIAPVDLTGAVLASSDEVIVGDIETPADQRIQLFSAVRLDLGKDVRLDAFGLKGRLEGSINTTLRPDEPVLATGELTIEDGKYKAYMQELEIERGRLFFAGGPIEDPGVDVRAIKKLPAVEAGINVRGTLRNPQLTFFSDPSMPQSQIASLLLVGRTLDSLQDADKTDITNARQTLINQGSSLLASQLGRYVGINDVGLESTSGSDTSLVLGRYFSPRLYVRYGISLSEAINTLKLRYTIGDRWVIKTESGAQQAADIEFTIER